MIPSSMQTVARWVVWCYSSEGKKLPHDPKNPSGRSIDATDEQFWVNYDTAAKVVAAGGVDGLGFVLGDDWAGVDLDDCVREPSSTTSLVPAAQAIVDQLDSYTEISPSGAGIKVFVRGCLGNNHSRKGLEIYGHARYFTVTGQHLAGTPTEPQARSEQLAELIGKEFPFKAERSLVERAQVGVAEGGRDNALASFGGGLRRQGLTNAELLAALLERNKTFQPPLPRRDVERIARSISRYEPAPDTFQQSEKGDAEFFVASFANAVRFDQRRARWLTINDYGIWLPDRTEVVAQYAITAMRERQRLANDISDTEQKRKAWTWAFRGESRARLANMLDLAKNIEPVSDRGQWDQQRHLLGAPNGVIDLRDGSLRNAEPDERITMCVGIDYDPDARSEVWEKAIREIFPHSGLPEFVHLLLGYSITGETQQDKWMIPNGTGGNGKTLLLSASRYALGDYALELPAKIFDRRNNDTYDLAKLPNKRLITCSESGDTVHLNHDRIKQLSGGDPLRAADKYEKSFEFVPEGKLWLTCNKRPRVTDDTIAFWRRVLVIPFTVTFAGQEDLTLRPTLERDPVHQRAVLAWLVRGAVRYYAEGLGAAPAIVRVATDAYRQESEPLAEFYEACCEIGEGKRAKASDLYAHYMKWASANGIRFSLSVKSFGQTVGQRFERRMNAGTWYVGIGLRESVQQEPVLPEAAGF